MFALGETRGLELTPEDRARVLTPREFEQHLATRADFAPNDGGLSRSGIDAIGELVRSLDRSDDADVQARHAHMVRKASGRLRRRRFRNRSGRPAKTTPRTAIRSQRDRRPVSPALQALLRQVVALMIPLAFIVALVNAGAIISTIEKVTGLFRPQVSPTIRETAPAQPAQPAIQHDIPQALSQLREYKPELISRLSDPDNPALSVVNGYPTYTWEYVYKSNDQAVSIRRISISLDESGRLVGVDER